MWLGMKDFVNMLPSGLEVPQKNTIMKLFKQWKFRQWVESCLDTMVASTGCRVFKQGVQNWKDFCLKIFVPKWNYWILKCNGEVSKSALIWLSK